MTFLLSVPSGAILLIVCGATTTKKYKQLILQKKYCKANAIISVQLPAGNKKNFHRNYEYSGCFLAVIARYLGLLFGG